MCIASNPINSANDKDQGSEGHGHGCEWGAVGWGMYGGFDGVVANCKRLMVLVSGLYGGDSL